MQLSDSCFSLESSISILTDVLFFHCDSVGQGLSLFHEIKTVSASLYKQLMEEPGLC